jgi:hypothetical protein
VESAVKEVQETLKSGAEALKDPAAAAANLYALITAVGGVINPNGFGDFDVATSDDESTGSEDQSAIDALFD